jgi:hypothetical protein
MSKPLSRPVGYEIGPTSSRSIGIAPSDRGVARKA